MQALFVSSGDVALDRRYRWALAFLRRGDEAAAADILEQVVGDAPGFATAWFTLAVIRERQGDRAGAVEAFEAAADPDDYHGARLHLARLGAGTMAPAMSASYVRRLFDQHATQFDEMLVNRLGYRGPQVLRDALARVDGAPARFASVLDLGCGTGLAGLAFRDCAAMLAGVDIAPRMVELARGQAIYDRLAVADIGDFLAGEHAAGVRHDLILAADVLVYCADVAPVARAAAAVLAPDGLFAFTVETHDGDGVMLGATLRYAHGADHVRTAIGDAGLALALLEDASVRNEAGRPVPGLVALARASQER